MTFKDKNHPERLYSIIDDSDKTKIKIKRLNPPKGYITKNITIPLKIFQTYFEKINEDN